MIMRGYHKLDLSKLNYTDKPISYEDALVNVTHLNIPTEICSGEQKNESNKCRSRLWQ